MQLWTLVFWGALNLIMCSEQQKAIPFNESQIQNLTIANTQTIGVMFVMIEF